MSYPLSYKGLRDKTTLYAIIQDRETSLFWDEVNDIWVAAITADCNLAFTEGADKGVYTATATFTPVNGGIYQITVNDSGDSDYSMDTVEVYPSKTKTVLQVIQAVQTDLRMPLSSAITDSLAKLILSKMNVVLLDLLPQNNIFDHLKVSGSFVIVNPKSLYRLAPVNVDFVDKINFLRLPDMAYISKAIDDIQFRSKADVYNASLSYGKPFLYRIAQRDSGFPIVELTPAPEEAMIVSYEILKGAKEMTAATEFVPLPRVIQAGALMLMKNSQGRDSNTEASLFQAALSTASNVSANSEMADVQV